MSAFKRLKSLLTTFISVISMNFLLLIEIKMMKNLYLQLSDDHETLVSCQIEQAPLNDSILLLNEASTYPNKFL